MTEPASPPVVPENTGLLLQEVMQELVELAPVLDGELTTFISGVCQDSRRVARGDLFVARDGAHSRAIDVIPHAIERGAAALLVEHSLELPDQPLPVLRVSDARRALALAAEAVFGFPSRALPVVAVTGTNGKSTTTCLVEQALLALGARPARLGTTGFSFDGEIEPTQHTTPEADEISRRLAAVRARGGTHFVMEASSHAIELERVRALTFDVAAFSNLTQDHLDFHGTMERYGATKARLFQELSPRAAVFNLDDAFGRELYEKQRASGKRAFGVSQRAADGELFARGSRSDRAGVSAELVHGAETCELKSRLIGALNIDNLLLALGILLELGYPLGAAAQALEGAPGAPGRLERCDEASDELLVVVDYAHTPDALERTLDALRPLTAGKLYCVFGCGGDRDASKRPLMGAAVAARADRAIITNDNPRTESPETIAQAIAEAFVDGRCPHVVELDRAVAIEMAILDADIGDIVLIAGKGHENYQIFEHVHFPFDDREQARKALARRREGSRS